MISGTYEIPINESKMVVNWDGEVLTLLDVHAPTQVQLASDEEAEAYRKDIEDTLLFYSGQDGWCIEEKLFDRFMFDSFSAVRLDKQRKDTMETIWSYLSQRAFAVQMWLHSLINYNQPEQDAWVREVALGTPTPRLFAAGWLLASIPLFVVLWLWFVLTRTIEQAAEAASFQLSLLRALLHKKGGNS